VDGENAVQKGFRRGRKKNPGKLIRERGDWTAEKEVVQEEEELVARENMNKIQKKKRAPENFWAVSARVRQKSGGVTECLGSKDSKSNGASTGSKERRENESRCSL